MLLLVGLKLPKISSKNLTPAVVKTGPPHFLFALYGDRKESLMSVIKTSPDSLKRPMAVAVAPDGRIYVADSGNSRIVVFGADGQRQLIIGQGSLKYPVALVYKEHKIYVVDSSLMKVAVFDDQGKELAPLLDKMIPPPGLGDIWTGIMIRPSSISIGSNNLFIISDIANQSIFIMNTSGQIIKRLGIQGKENGNFNYPGGLWVDKNKYIYVADSNNGRIQMFDNTGDFLTTIDGTQGKYDRLVLPRGIAVLEDGTIVVADVMQHRLRAFDAIGSELWSIGGMGKENGLFYFPNSFCLDSVGRIYVADRENDRIEVFGY